MAELVSRAALPCGIPLCGKLRYPYKRVWLCHVWRSQIQRWTSKSNLRCISTVTITSVCGVSCMVVSERCTCVPEDACVHFVVLVVNLSLVYYMARMACMALRTRSNNNTYHQARAALPLWREPMELPFRLPPGARDEDAEWRSAST
jgi:hypothetical protein